MLGEEGKPVDEKQPSHKQIEDSDTEIEEMSEDEEPQQEDQEMSEGSAEESDSDSDSAEEEQGTDQLQSSYFDIPQTNGIPVISQLAKEEKKKNPETSGLEKKSETSKKINHFIETKEDELETHFVENPFIKLREKSTRKKQDSKVALQAVYLEKNNNFDDEDIVLMKDQNKFVIKDLEQNKDDKLKAKKLKRMRLISGVYVAGEDMGDDTSSEDEAVGVSSLHKRVKDQRFGQKKDSESLFD